MKTFTSLLRKIPAPGVGSNYHTAIYGVACRGHEEGLSDAAIVAAIREHTLPGGRVVTDREIEDTVRNAKAGKKRIATPYSGPRIRPDFQAECLREGAGATMEDIAARSPVKLDWDDEEGWRALEFLYAADELLFIGDDRTAGSMGESIRACGDWCAEFRDDAVYHPKIIPNPLTGCAASRKSGGETLRGDGNVETFRFAIAESDSLALEAQCAFWMGCPSLPVAALIFSGSKSIHAWLRVDCADAAAWEREIAGQLFPGFLVPLGMDASCRNPARLSRMPGFFRMDKDEIQTLIYLAPEGKAVAA